MCDRIPFTLNPIGVARSKAESGATGTDVLLPFIFKKYLNIEILLSLNQNNHDSDEKKLPIISINKNITVNLTIIYTNE